jgi:hypothetical protein
MDVPPSRYKVVEQGRRLVVIDTWNGDRPVTRQAARPDTSARTAPPAAPRTDREPPNRRPGPASGIDAPDTVITTQPWFDRKGPRRVKLDGSAHGMLLVVLAVGVMAVALIYLMWGWPALIVIGFLLAQKPIRGGLRAGATAWLDSQQQG